MPCILRHAIGVEWRSGERKGLRKGVVDMVSTNETARDQVDQDEGVGRQTGKSKYEYLTLNIYIPVTKSYQ